MKVNQIKAGAALSYVVLGLNTLSGLLYLPYMLRMMGQSEYGLYMLASSVIAYLTILDMGFGNAIVRYTARFRALGQQQNQYAMFGMFIMLYSLIGLLAVAAGVVLYFNVDMLFANAMTPDELHKAGIIMLIACLNLAISFPMSIFGAIVTAYENFVFQRVVSIMRILLSTATMIAMLEMGYRAIGMVLVTTAFNLLIMGVNWWYCRGKLRIRIIFARVDRKFLKEIGSYSFYIFLSSIMDRVYWSTGQIVLGAMSGTVAVAVYSLAITLMQLYQGMSTAISGVFLPRVTTMVTVGQSDKTISDLFIRTGRIQYAILSSVLAGFIIFGRQFLNYWAGAEYDGSYIVAVLFFAALTPPLIQNLGITVLQARNQMKFRSVLYVIIALCCLAVSIPLAKAYGAVGCAAGTAGALVLGNCIIINIYYYYKQRLDVVSFWKQIGRMSLGPMAVCAATVVALRFYTPSSVIALGGTIAVFAVAYYLVLWFTSLNRYEKDLITDITGKVFRLVKSRIG